MYWVNGTKVSRREKAMSVVVTFILSPPDGAGSPGAWQQCAHFRRLYRKASRSTWPCKRRKSLGHSRCIAKMLVGHKLLLRRLFYVQSDRTSTNSSQRWEQSQLVVLGGFCPFSRIARERIKFVALSQPRTFLKPNFSSTFRICLAFGFIGSTPCTSSHLSIETKVLFAPEHSC
jgi:hypothetical protein